MFIYKRVFLLIKKLYTTLLFRQLKLLLCFQLSPSCSYEKIVIELFKNKDFGFNARTGEVEDLAKQGIVDPFNIVKNAVLYSTNMTTQFVSIADAIISDVKNLSIEPLDEVIDPGRGIFSELV